MSIRCEIPPTGVAAAMAARFAALVPVITTNRLVLRAPRVSDFDLYADIACSERGRHIGGPMSREDAWFDFIQFSSSWLLHGHGGWTLAIKGDDDPIGFLILGLEPGDRETELGYMLDQNAEGHGYATEAARALRDWAFETYGWSTLVSYITDGNTASQALATRLGATRDAMEETALDNKIRVYRHLASEAHP